MAPPFPKPTLTRTHTHTPYCGSQKKACFLLSLVQHDHKLQVTASNEGDGAEVTLLQTKTCIVTYTHAIMVISGVTLGRAAPRA